VSAASEIHRAIDAVWRIESARLIAGLARIVRDVGLAQDLAQDALVAALERWPESGVPNNHNARERQLLRGRAAACGRESAGAPRETRVVPRGVDPTTRRAAGMEA